MTWLSYSDDEVGRFHPLFYSAANRALDDLGLRADFEWKHHLRLQGNQLIPDFVMRERDSGRWRLALEVKRGKGSVNSIRNQVQAKSYAEENQYQYALGFPTYFALSNLERTVLFALRDSAPPEECRIRNGAYEVGEFADFSPEVFRDRLIEELVELVTRIASDRSAEFDQAWLRTMVDYARYANEDLGIPLDSEPETPGWEYVRDYFCTTTGVQASRLFFFRCLAVEFLGGALRRFEHPSASHMPSLTASGRTIGGQTARALGLARRVDFEQIFEDEVGDLYRGVEDGDAAHRLREYIESITSSGGVAQLVLRGQLDVGELLDGLLAKLHPDGQLDERGKVQTDPDLARLLASVAIDEPSQCVMDPCCGHGILLEAAYDRLADLGLDNDAALQQLSGVEADGLLVRFCVLRLLLKEPRLVTPGLSVAISWGDMFAAEQDISTADVLLINPPFKRYEAQDRNPVPDELRRTYCDAIRTAGQSEVISAAGQQNLFTYYVEFAVAAASEGTTLAFILDNKWYHNAYGEALRRLLLKRCELAAIIEYPRWNLFEGFSIATSILLCRKMSAPRPNHEVQFVRCTGDLTEDCNAVGRALRGSGAWPRGWSSRSVCQDALDASTGWRTHFSPQLVHDFTASLPNLPELFERSRRGSLAKEEGGVSPLAFPFSRSSFGHVRASAGAGARRFQTQRVRALNDDENMRLRELAAKIPDHFRGFALNTSDGINSLELTEEELLREPTLEPPKLRSARMFETARKVPWGRLHEEALQEVRGTKEVDSFLSTFRSVSGLSEELMPNEKLLVGLREPYAGELIVPRKMRTGHRVHVNPYAWHGDRQVRLSSNFISYSGCLAVQPETDLDRELATQLIVAFLLSSFGQLQFEMLGYNREGCLAVEKTHVDRVKVLDPRMIPPDERAEIVDTMREIPFPVPSDRLSSEIPERVNLDTIFARLLAQANEWDGGTLLIEVQQLLDEYLVARSP